MISITQIPFWVWPLIYIERQNIFFFCILLLLIKIIQSHTKLEIQIPLIFGAKSNFCAIWTKRCWKVHTMCSSKLILDIILFDKQVNWITQLKLFTSFTFSCLFLRNRFIFYIELFFSNFGYFNLNKVKSIKVNSFRIYGLVCIWQHFLLLLISVWFGCLFVDTLQSVNHIWCSKSFFSMFNWIIIKDKLHSFIYLLSIEPLKRLTN